MKNTTTKGMMLAVTGMLLAGVVLLSEGSQVMAQQAQDSQPTTRSARRWEMRKDGVGFEKMIKARAQILGMSEDELRNALKDKSFLQILEEKGMSRDQFRAKMQENCPFKH